MADPPILAAFGHCALKFQKIRCDLQSDRENKGGSAEGSLSLRCGDHPVYAHLQRSSCFLNDGWGRMGAFVK